MNSISRYTFFDKFSTILTWRNRLCEKLSMLISLMPFHISAIDDIHDNNFTTLPSLLILIALISLCNTVLLNDVVDIRELILYRVCLLLIYPFRRENFRDNFIDDIVAILCKRRSNELHLLTVIIDNPANINKSCC